MSSVSTGDLTRLLDDLVDRLAEVEQAIVLSPDGMLIAASCGLPPALAEHLAAVVAAMQGLSTGAGRQLGAGVVRQTVVEMERALLFVTTAHRGSILAVLVSSTAEVGAIPYEMAVVADRADRHVASLARHAVMSGSAGGSR